MRLCSFDEMSVRKQMKIVNSSSVVAKMLLSLFVIVTITTYQNSCFIFSLSTSAIPSRTTVDVHTLTDINPLGKALIDYSTATEFIEEHYNIPLYFGTEIRREQPVYDARKGVLVSSSATNEHKNPQLIAEPAKLDECGFELFSAPTKVQDFQDMQQIRSYYIQEMKDLIPKALGVNEDDVEALVLWHPTFRGEGIEVGSRSEARPGLGPIASRAHIDTDVGAYGLEGVCNLVDKNRVEIVGIDKDSYSMKEALMKACEDRRRMILLNLWRPLLRVQSAPLGVLATKYDTALSPQEAIFPHASPSNYLSHWYVFPNMQSDECLIFKQYDRRLDKMSDIWHCALNIQESSQNQDTLSPSPRRSFDIKAMVVLKEKVPENLDRLEAATRPLLTWEESGQFCNSQAGRLKAEDLEKATS